jgi:hypothetical protein
MAVLNIREIGVKICGWVSYPLDARQSTKSARADSIELSLLSLVAKIAACARLAGLGGWPIERTPANLAYPIKFLRSFSLCFSH